MARMQGLVTRVQPPRLQILTQVKGLSEAKVEKIVEAVRKMDDSGKFKSGLAVMQQREKEIRKISTGCRALDDILGGGIETRGMTELHGEYRHDRQDPTLHDAGCHVSNANRRGWCRCVAAFIISALCLHTHAAACDVTANRST
eukprot:351012-Chlamydomonas_euryale.AAC.10